MQILLIILYCLAAIVGFIVGFLLCLILFTIIVSLFADKNKTYLKHSRFYRRLLNFWTWIMTKMLCIRIHVTGMEKMQNVKGRFLLVSNHRSNFDPILTWFVFKKYDVAFISKIENFSVPFFGAIIRKCCFLDIDRENPANALKTIDTAANLMKNDVVSFGAYPEGTRSKECVLLPFKNGLFKIATKAKTPIAVITIQGTEKIAKQPLFKRHDVYIDLLEVLDEDYVSSHRTVEIGAEVEKTMREKI